uniref:Uncharacterized protein MANES_02G172300 n=1 Tax=Rhizophora mucronata TaxID=61149 RepID=A0A2P2IWM6_RHIMU
MPEPGTNFPKNHVHFSDLAGGLNNYSYDSTNYGVRRRKTAENYAKFRGWNSGETMAAVEDERVSGVSSPPLWRTSPPRSPQHRQNYYRSLSPTSKAQAIARGQRELMEMVNHMPEGCYELSLKDIVEVEWPMVEVKQETSHNDMRLNGEEVHRREIDRRRKSQRKAEINRTGSINNRGFLLKMVFPVSFWGSRNKKKKNSARNETVRDGRVSPRPLLLSDGPGKGVDEEWWTNRYSVSAESESVGFSSNNSGSSKSSRSASSGSRNSSRHMSGGCCFFMLTKKGKRVVD